MPNLPEISVVCSGISGKSQKKFYDTLSQSDIDFEIVMTRNIKPAQYIEIGVRNASSDLIIFLADDLKCDNKFLYKMY